MKTVTTVTLVTLLLLAACAPKQAKLGEPVTSPLGDYSYVKVGEAYEVLINSNDPRVLARVQKEICGKNYCRPQLVGQAWHIVVTPK